MTRKILSTRTLRLLAVAIVAVSFTAAVPAPVEANWFSNTWHKAKHAAKKAAHAAKHAAKSAEKGAEKAGHDVEKGAKEAGKDIQKGAEAAGQGIEKGAEAALSEMKKLSGQLTRITGTCETATDKFGHAISSAMPSITVAGLPQLSNKSCEVNQTSGFMCGIFPYANNIVKALGEGAHDMKSLANHVGDAYNGGPCARYSKVDPNRGVCALFVGLAEETKEGVECIIDVAKNIAREKGGGDHHFNETQICHAVGEFEFGFVADKLAVASAADENQKLIKFAQLLRTALALKGEAAKSVENIPSCRAARR